jgi:hypothetical protein
MPGMLANPCCSDKALVVRSSCHRGLLVSCALNRSDKSRLGVWREQEGPRLNWC